MSNLVFLDVETTGLDPRVHRVWEWAVIVDGIAYTAQVELPVGHIEGVADPESLAIGGFHDRYGTRVHTARTAAADIARLTDGRTLCGAQTHFDARFLGDLLLEQGITPGWHHRVYDVESAAMAVFGWPEPRSLSDTARALRIDLDGYERHTAADDARLAAEVHDRLQAFAVCEECRGRGHLPGADPGQPCPACPTEVRA